MGAGEYYIIKGVFFGLLQSITYIRISSGLGREGVDVRLWIWGQVVLEL